MLELIKNLRTKTGCGMSDCKSALEEANGDIAKASELLRKRGMAKAAKRADREATEGIILAEVNADNTEGYMLEINSETDFVSRNEKFQDFAKKIFEVVKTNKPADKDALFNLEMDDSTVQAQLETLSGTIGEKLEIKDVAVVSGNVIGAYIHGNGRIGILTVLSGGDAELARDVAMQVAAANPKYINPEEVTAEEIEQEKDVYREQLKNEGSPRFGEAGKPEEMIEKIIDGKLNKFYSEICLIKQEYIKDDSQKVEDILGDAKVEKFIRFAL